MADPRPPNRLAGETSPYLLQHAHNPVDWWPWGPDALARAKLLDRPIFLSIGYAACHWCHVMERESFEDEATAAVLNANFIPIKVDREERPDLDQVYMSAVQAMTGSGGWPMSVFLTPAGRPFFGGTYFPDTPRHGMPSFRQVLEGVAAAWQRDRAGVEGAGSRLVEAIAAPSRPTAGGSAWPAAAVLDAAAAGIEQSFDTANGGWGHAPKFPQPMTIEFLLRRHAATGDGRPLAVARRSLDAMADGGIRDQLGGGFHRYSTTADWLVPHFEQMLYDNAQLARVYGHAYAATRDRRYLEVATAALDYLLRELRTADGGFAASQDADTDGEEGGTFTWTLDEIREVLGADAALFAAAYGVEPGGNWEGRAILSRVRDDASAAAHVALDPAEVPQRLAAARAALHARRRQRPQPARDDKVLAAWNGLAIAALADTTRILRAAEPADPRVDRYLSAAGDAAALVLERLLVDGRLRRSWKDGRASADGVLEDHANLADGLLSLYEATFEERWFTAARDLVEAILERFSDPAGGFFDTAADAEPLVVRPKDVQDNATPSGGAMTATVLLRLEALTGEGRYRDAAARAVGSVGELLARYPTGFAQWLVALDFAHAAVAEVALVGTQDEAGTAALAAATALPYRPSLVLAGSAHPEQSSVPLLRHRTRRDGRATAYVCRGFACRLPVTDAAALERELAALGGA